MKKLFHSNIIMALLAAGMADAPLMAQEPNAADDTTGGVEAEAPASLSAKGTDFAAAEKDLSRETYRAESHGRPGSAGAGEAAVIETSRPYLLPRLFTLPTAYSLQSYELRFGGQGNIHSTLADMNTEGIKGSVSIGLGGIMELGYQLDEYYTVEDISDKILMGYFKLSLLRESRFLPAVSISAAKNLRSRFRTPGSFDYDMDEDMYEVAFSKAFHLGDNVVSFHPGAQILRDEVTGIQGVDLNGNLKTTKVNPRLGISWQSRPKTLFMYEFKLLNPTEVSRLDQGGIETHPAMENNLGIRYYIRNWLCIDSGIRHYYDLEKNDDEMKLHANFVGVVPLATLYERIENHFKK